ncbi:MAG: fructose-1,6-bisphosphatase [Firmicutes bacterium]|nr:fructose-1,6-bisphosphatase [Bacillota bacterium]
MQSKDKAIKLIISDPHGEHLPFIDLIKSKIGLFDNPKNSLCVLGDIYDRGARPDLIIDFLIANLNKSHDNICIVFGNHDVLWLGAMTGNLACIANALRVNIAYNNFDFLKVGCGIDLRPLSGFAGKMYEADPCERFKIKAFDQNETADFDLDSAAKMHKAISIIQFKLEADLIIKNPNLDMIDRIHLDKIDFESGTVVASGKAHPLLDNNFPSINKDNPFALSAEEKSIIDDLQKQFLSSKNLQKHLDFFKKVGCVFKKYDGRLLFHACVNMQNDKKLKQFSVKPLLSQQAANKKNVVQGQSYFEYLQDYIDFAIGAKCKGGSPNTKAEKSGKPDYKTDCKSDTKADQAQIQSDPFFWQMWCSKNSPFFGKEKMATFERFFVADKDTHAEPLDPYFAIRENKNALDLILNDFDISSDGTIVNGHMPVKVKNDENPFKAGKKLICIDGGMTKSYQKATGIKGYYLIDDGLNLSLYEI